MGARRGAYWILVGMPEGKRPLGSVGVDRRVITNSMEENLS